MGRSINFIVKSDLEFRQIITNTIESRGLGEVIEETSAPNMLEIVVEVKENHCCPIKINTFSRQIIANQINVYGSILK